MESTVFTDFYQFLGTLFRLYREQRYTEAQRFLGAARELYPEWGWLIDNWRASLAALMDEPTLALDILRNVHRRGEWLPEFYWMDADYDGLRAHPEFKNLHAQSIALRTIAEKNACSEMVVYAPRRSAVGPHPLLIGLHGHSSNAPLVADYWRMASEYGWLVAVPQAGQVVAPQMYSWGVDDLHVGLTEVVLHVQSLQRDYPVNPTCMVVGGFALGAELGLALILKGLVPARALIGVALSGPYTHGELDFDALLADARVRNGRAHFFVGGQDDPAVGENTAIVAEKLRGLGWSVKVEVVENIGHGFPREFAMRLPELLALAIDER